MNIFDFLTEDEIQEAPEDPSSAFSYLIRIVQSRFEQRLERLSEMESEGHAWDDARVGFMSTVIGLGRTYQIEPFATMDVPRYQRFSYDDFRQFKGDLDHYLAQLVLGNSLRHRRDSIPISGSAKQRIRTHLHHIKEYIDTSEVPDSKRAFLHAKLAEFEVALEKGRLNVLAIGRVVLEMLSVSCNVLALADSQKRFRNSCRTSWSRLQARKQRMMKNGICRR